jgi:hypothetical protein
LLERKDLNYKLTSEYFAYRNVSCETKKSLQDQIDLARLENEELLKQLEQSLVNDSQDSEYTENLY